MPTKACAAVSVYIRSLIFILQSEGMLLLPKIRSISWYKMSIENPKGQVRSLSWSAEE